MKLRNKIVTALLITLFAFTATKAHAESRTADELNVDQIVNKKIMIFGNLVNLRSVAISLNGVLDTTSKRAVHELVDAMGTPTKAAQTASSIELISIRPLATELVDASLYDGSVITR